MFPRPEIRRLLKDFVLVELYTDGTDALPTKPASWKTGSSGRWRFLSTRFSTRNEHVIATFPALPATPGSSGIF